MYGCPFNVAMLPDVIMFLGWLKSQCFSVALLFKCWRTKSGHTANQRAGGPVKNHPLCCTYMTKFHYCTAVTMFLCSIPVTLLLYCTDTIFSVCTAGAEWLIPTLERSFCDVFPALACPAPACNTAVVLTLSDKVGAPLPATAAGPGTVPASISVCHTDKKKTSFV